MDQYFYASSSWNEGTDDDSEKVVFNEGIYPDFHDLYDYSWEYSSSKNSIYSIRKTLKEKRIPCVFAGGSAERTETLRTEAYKLFERDLKSEKTGRLYINGYYLNCNIIGTKNSNYYKYNRVDTELIVVCADPTWHKETVYTFSKIVDSRGGEDPPLDFPFDFGYASESSSKVITNDVIVSSPFRLNIYGPCVNPSIEIAGHIYRLNGTIAENEYVEIVADKSKDTRTIYKKTIGDASEENWFGHRYKEQSVFEEIPEGNVRVSWDGTFGFELTLSESRSEPPWYFEKYEKHNEPVIDYSMYLMDSDGSYILDNYGEFIEVEG